ncbi:hypothetical protein KUV85_09220 [Nocardioides panacisoli]|uniref:TetR/AcrR family transcriptional regulator n=1 Tax=Nocardioides panacisoli TaxID=627624 RepID=UPI001C62D12B|nr:hypothetical protein [Nocardioides panacisoli]QYJ02520.1 hypothetical protein KUV85_09220 [Nocardioides panacisoli]
MSGQTGVYRGVSAADRAARRRSELLEATLAVWADPERRTTMTAVCQEARLTERYFYESFRDLDDALTTLMDVIATEIEDTCTAASEAAGEDAARRTHAMLAALLGLLQADPRKGRVALVAATAAPRLRQRRTELLHRFAHRVAEEARLTPGLRTTGGHEDDVAGLLFIGGVAELVTGWLDGTVAATPEEIVATASRSHLGLFGYAG